MPRKPMINLKRRIVRWTISAIHRVNGIQKDQYVMDEDRCLGLTEVTIPELSKELAKSGQRNGHREG
ncbi:hypothetical protein E5D57_000218 [Metarhizium anisopliae]|nr:hypothetical protein E5D57_000218 [Metarhizium anisopliae]